MAELQSQSALLLLQEQRSFRRTLHTWLLEHRTLAATRDGGRGRLRMPSMELVI